MKFLLFLLKVLWGMTAFFFAFHFSMQNKAVVTLQYSFQGYQWLELTQVPLFLVILCSIFLGVLIGGLGDLFRRFQLKREIRQSRKTIEKLEKEIQSLRGLGSARPSFLKEEG